LVIQKESYACSRQTYDIQPVVHNLLLLAAHSYIRFIPFCGSLELE